MKFSRSIKVFAALAIIADGMPLAGANWRAQRRS
jgi:hypothetical protein